MEAGNCVGPAVKRGDIIRGAMLQFNWGVFWAVLAATGIVQGLDLLGDVANNNEADCIACRGGWAYLSAYFSYMNWIAYKRGLPWKYAVMISRLSIGPPAALLGHFSSVMGPVAVASPDALSRRGRALRLLLQLSW